MRLIDADAFIVDSIQNKRFVFRSENIESDSIIVETVYGDLLDAVGKMPTIDAEPVKRGRWNTIIDRNNGELLECSNCRYLFRRLFPRRYCPSCGAKMDGEV